MIRTPFYRIFIAALSVALVSGSTGCSKKTPDPVTKTEFELLGTSCSVTLYDKGKDEVFKRIFDRVREIEKRMTINSEDSEIMEVNNAAGKEPKEVSDDTFFVVQQGLEFGLRSSGAFDITIGPVVKAWGIHTDHARIPGDDELAALLPLVNFRNVDLGASKHTIYLTQPGMVIDLGGIAKGYASDEAARIIMQAGLKHALINFGGNVVVIGTKPDGSLWRIGIQNPEEPRGDYLAIVQVADKAVITSGVYERFFEKDGVRYHHILDTKTGYPVRNGLTGVTIVGARGITCDALSTAVFSLGIEKGLALVESMEGIDAIFITEDHKVVVSQGIKEVFRLTNTKFTMVEPAEALRKE